MLNCDMLEQEDHVNKMIGDIIAHRENYPHQVFIPQPTKPWESEYWVSDRDSLTYRLGQYIESNGIILNRDYSYWFLKVDFLITFGFKEAKHAVLFKLAHGSMY
jgi:hypothetical protein